MTTPEVRRPEEVSRQNGLEQAIDHYKQSNFFLNLSESTRPVYAADLAQFRQYCRTQDILSIGQVKSEDTRNWRNQLAQNGYAPATINRKRASLSGFLEWARAEGIIQPDFAESLPKHEPVAKKQPRILSAEQAETLIILRAKNLRDASLILIALTTGASITEIINLNAEDIFSTKEGNHVVSFKGGIIRFPRTLVINKKIGDIITGYKKANGLKPGNPLFQGYVSNRDRLTERRLTRAAVDLMLKRYGREIGVENLNSSMLRNTFIAGFKGNLRQLNETLGGQYP